MHTVHLGETGDEKTGTSLHLRASFSPHCWRWKEGGDVLGLCCPLCILRLLLLLPPPQNRSDDDDDSRIKSRFSFSFPSSTERFHLRVPRPQGCAQRTRSVPRKEEEEEEENKEKGLSPTRGRGKWVFFVPILSRPGRGETKKPAQKNLLFSRGFCLPHSFYPSFHPLMPNHHRRPREGQFSILSYFPTQKNILTYHMPKRQPPLSITPPPPQAKPRRFIAGALKGTPP